MKSAWVLIVIALLIIMASALAVAAPAAPVEEEGATFTDKAPPGEQIANLPPAAEIPRLTLKATAAPKTIIIPKELEFSTLGGITFPGATGGICASWLFAEDEAKWARFFADLGLTFVDQKPLTALIGVSTTLSTAEGLGVASRIGLGGFIPFDRNEHLMVGVYVRFPIGKTSTMAPATGF